MTPQLLKPAVTKTLIELTAPIQEAFQKSSEWQEIALKAYPPPEKKVKEKKVKDKGTRHPVRSKEGEAGADDAEEGEGDSSKVKSTPESRPTTKGAVTLDSSVPAR